MTIGERIKKLRQSQKRTQQSMADALNLKRQTIAAYEIGTIAPSDRTISDICREFNVSEQWLRTGEGEMLRRQSRSDELATFIADLMQSEPDNIRLRFVSAISRLSTKELEILEKAALHIASELHSSSAENSQYYENSELPMTVEEAEAEYIKSKSASAQNTDLNASSSTAAEKSKLA